MVGNISLFMCVVNLIYYVTSALASYSIGQPLHEPGLSSLSLHTLKILRHVVGAHVHGNMERMAETEHVLHQLNSLANAMHKCRSSALADPTES